VVPVEVRIGTIEGALEWDGVDPLNSTDVYHQGIGRDTPSGWQYFTKEEKQDYLRTYKPGKQYECWMRPGSGTNEVVFHKQAISFRLIPELIFCVIVLFLCVATGVCMVRARPCARCCRAPAMPCVRVQALRRVLVQHRLLRVHVAQQPLEAGVLMVPWLAGHARHCAEYDRAPFFCRGNKICSRISSNNETD
jgi:hypothetical protein